MLFYVYTSPLAALNKLKVIETLVKTSKLAWPILENFKLLKITNSNIRCSNKVSVQIACTDTAGVRVWGVKIHKFPNNINQVNYR